MNLDDIILSEISQAQKENCQDLVPLWNQNKIRLAEAERRIVIRSMESMVEGQGKGTTE